MPDLKADGQIQARAGFSARPHHLLATMSIHGHGFFAIHMFTGCDGCQEMFRMQKWWRGNQNGVNVLRFQKLQVRTGTQKQIGCLYFGVLLLPGQLIEVVFGRCQAIPEKFSNRHHPSIRAIHERSCHVGAPTPASNEPQLDRRVGRGPKHRFGLHEGNPCGSHRGRLEKIASSNF